MSVREELEIRRQLQSAMDAGDVKQELAIRRQLAKIPQIKAQKDFDAAEMAKNIPGSAVEFARDIYRAVSQPKQTLEAVGGLVESGLERLNPFIPPEQYQYQQYPEAVIQAMKERYGGREEALRTLQEDPVGLLADVSGALTGAGTVARVPAITRAGVALDPLNIVTNVPKAGLTAAIPKGAPASIYESAVKFPPVSVPRKVRERAIETALREKVMPTYAGIDKINDRLGKMDLEINNLINAADASGKKIHRYRLYDELFELQKDLKQGADAPKNIRSYKKIVGDLEDMLSKGPDKLKPSQVQRFKTQTYRDINWRERKGPSAKTKTMQALARGARKAIEDVTPEIADINRRYGPLAELRDILPQPAHRISNLNPISLTTPLTTTAGGVAGGPLGAIGGALLGATQRPQIAARTALALRGLQEQGLLGALTSGSPIAQMMRQGLLQSGRLNELMETEL